MGATSAHTDRRTIHLGPMARRLLAHRRRWIRWTAVGLGVLAVASALSQAHRPRTARTTAPPAVVARRPLRAGQVLRPGDLTVVPGARRPGEPAPFARVDAAAGRVALRGMRAGEAVTPANAVPILRYYGVAARVPPGMRAVNLVVPPTAAFGGELTPLSRVDLLGAFAAGQEQAAATLITTGIVLRLAPGSEHVPPTLARVNALGGTAEGQGTAPVEIEVAVPRSRERDVILAEAFGRIFLAVHSAAAEAPHAEASAPLHLLRYLQLPPAGTTPMFPAPRQQPQGGPVLPGTLAPWGSRVPQEASPPAPGTTAPGLRGSGPGGWIVEVIEGDERFEEAVPRVGEPGAPAAQPLLPGLRTR